MPPTPPATVATPFDGSRPWALHPQVSLRPESFGALAYHFGTRRLSFLKSRTLLAVVESLADQPTGHARLPAAGVTAAELGAYERALATLADVGDDLSEGGADDPGRRPEPIRRPGTGTATTAGRLVDRFERGLDAPICLTWELTYACNLACVHCLSSSGRRDPDELTTAECKALIDEFERMQIFYVNIGGGEPTVRADFWELVDYATDHHVGVKFSTNGSRITAGVAERLAASDYVDVQISLDGATAEVNDAVRGRRLVRHRRHGHGTAGRGRLRRLQAVGGGHPPQRHPARRLQGAGRPATGPSSGSPGCARRAGGPTSGTSSIPPPSSSGTSTTGWSATARTS